MPKEETVELIKIKNAIIVKAGVTTEADPSGKYIQDANNIIETGNYWKDMVVVIIDGDNKGLARRIISMASPNIIIVYPAFPNAVAINTSYRILSNIVAASNITPMSYITTHTHVNNTTEQTVFSVAAGAITADYALHFNMMLDLSNLTQKTTIREYAGPENAANYKQITAKVFPTDFDPGTKLINIVFETSSDYKITLQSAVAEGSDKAVIIQYIRVIKT